jgi:hypothetical protein
MKLLAVAIAVIIFVLIFTVMSTYEEKKHYEIVVAKYNEDVSWTRPYRYVKVYDKSKGDLPNIGRESHTYLTYIVENYENLPDVVFFSQGCKDDHCGNIPIENFINIDGMYSENYSYLNSEHYFYNKESQNFNKDHLYYYKENKLYDDKLGYRLWFKTYVDENHNIDEGVTLWWGAIFSVKRECILSRPKKYYQMLLDYIPHDSNPEVGHYFERSWFYIFNCHAST